MDPNREWVEQVGADSRKVTANAERLAELAPAGAEEKSSLKYARVVNGFMWREAERKQLSRKALGSVDTSCHSERSEESKA